MHLIEKIYNKKKKKKKTSGVPDFVLLLKIRCNFFKKNI